MNMSQGGRSPVYNISVLCLFLAVVAGQRRPSNWISRKAANGYENPYNGDLSENGVVYRPVPLDPLSAAAQPSDSGIIVVPRMGSVHGRIAYKIIRNRPINAFLNIRYGVVGSGLGRFQRASPVRYEPSDGVIDATQVARNCPQFPDLRIVNDSEARGEAVDDCLTLNIYTPNKPGYSFPVIVFVHGEMLFDGTAEEGQPDYFLEHDVVLVTVNYRLAPFGFLTTLTDDMPGNVALADLHMALEWIQQYIRPFGGDPSQVTLLGQAGGATLVHALSLSSKANGLFHKLILQSGTALNPYFLDEDPLTTTRNFARLARCPIANNARSAAQEFSDCLGRMSTTELLKLMERHWETNEQYGIRFTGGYKLVVGDRLGYLDRHPAALLASSYYPLLAGVTKDVGAFIMSRSMFTQLQQVRSANVSDYINVVLKHTSQPRHYAIWQRLALEHIFDDEDIRNPTLDKLAQGLLELVNLILYRGPLVDSMHYNFRRSSTFLYCFDYRGEYHRFGHLRNPLPFATDATLSDDSIYLFPYPEEVSVLNPEDRTLSRAMVIMWINFVKENVPNPNPGVWPSVSTEYGPFVRFTNSKENTLELDYHFGEGIAVPILYPELQPKNTTRQSTTTTTTRAPWINPNPAYRYPNYEQRRNPPYETVLNGQTNLPYRHYPQQQQQQHQHQRQPYSNQYGAGQ